MLAETNPKSSPTPVSDAMRVLRTGEPLSEAIWRLNNLKTRVSRIYLDNGIFLWCHLEQDVGAGRQCLLT